MTKTAVPEISQYLPEDNRDDFGFDAGTGRFAALNLPAAVPPILTNVAGETGLTREQEYGRMLKTLVSNVPGMVYRCRNDADWTMEFVSDGFERLTGYRTSDILLNHRIRFEDLIHPDDRSLMHKAMAEVAGRLGEPFDVEYRIMHADSSIRWVWERGIGVYAGSPQPIAYEGLIQDITARKLAEHAVVETERRYRGLFDNAIEGIFRTSSDGHFIEANPALALICGFESVDELVNSCRDIGTQLYVDPERRAKFMHLISVRGSVSGFESQIYRKSGDVIWVSENARAVVDDRGNIQAYEGMLADITERKLYQARIEQQANYDTLTGLANRSLLQDRLQQSMLACSTYGSRLAVAFVDLDRFKFINDSLGHHIGDELLKCMAKRLVSCVRDIDTVARLGGDEFVLLIHDQPGADSLRKMMERILAVIAEPWLIEQGEFNVTASMGVARYPDDGTDAQTLLKHADSAMYRAKDRGRNGVQFFTNDINVQMIENLEMESKLRRALEREQFLLHYQPRIDLRSGACLGAEALIRWQISPQETISPDRFIPLAEETGLIVPIGRWVLETACKQNKAWQEAGFEPMVVSVNVSARQFRQDDFVHTVAAVLKKTGLEARYLEIELTESMVMHDAERLVAMLDELKSIGVQISVDDFGTGYSSLSYLKRFPVDRLKIDRSFVQDLMSDTDDATIVRTIIALGHNLGLHVVAEGVETAEQSDFLRQNGCDEAQGYLFGRPVPSMDFVTRPRSRLTAP